ncbi:MAG: M20/M25/M40 family metallo-hydrolase [Planctomycetes bacterium]|nr:M20/M25/M40 family metallo-hydrolase [Planctomycetota bacterium]
MSTTWIRRRRTLARRPWLGAASAALLTCAAIGAFAVAAASAAQPRVGLGDPVDSAAWKTGYATILTADLQAHGVALASPELEGRDTPSAGLALAAEYVASRFADAGLEPFGELVTGPDAKRGFRWRYSRTLASADPEGCELVLRTTAAAGGVEPTERRFELGREFVPVVGARGKGNGALVFCGFGINAKRDGWEEVKAKQVDGAIAMIVESEPRHPKLFDGPEITREAELYEKLGDFTDAGAQGVIVVRREPEKTKSKLGPRPEPAPLSLRANWARWNDGRTFQTPEPPAKLVPAIEVDAETAKALLGQDALELAQKIEKQGRTVFVAPKGRTVSLAAATKGVETDLENVVGLVRGTDAAFAEEYVVVGAHYDHIGVDSAGRIGCGADDNASGTAALIELAQAFATAPPRRSVLFVAFSGEEHGLWGSQAFARNPPVAAEKLVAMLNMDMLGRGEPEEVAVLGLVQNPELEKVLVRAKALSKTGVTKIVMRQGEELFQRSDHFSFHQIGVPVLFFFEGLPIEKNEDYHTWRDTLDKLDFDKLTRSTRLAFNTVWVLATDDERPPKPR